MKICPTQSNLELLRYYHELEYQIEYIVEEHIYTTMGMDVKRLSGIVRLFDDTISVQVWCDDDNLYTFILNEELEVIK